MYCKENKDTFFVRVSDIRGREVKKNPAHILMPEIIQLLSHQTALITFNNSVHPTCCPDSIIFIPITLRK